MEPFQASNCRDYNQGGFSETESSVSILFGLSQLHVWVQLFLQIHSSSTLVVIPSVVLPGGDCSWVPTFHLSPYNLPVSVASGPPWERCPPWPSLGCVTWEHHPMWPRLESVRYTRRLSTTSWDSVTHPSVLIYLSQVCLWVLVIVPDDTETQWQSRAWIWSSKLIA